MAAKSINTPATPKARRKSQISVIAANIIFIDPAHREKAEELRKGKEFFEYRDSLSEDGRKIFFNALKFIVKWRAAKDEGKICKVIRFPVSCKQSREV